MIVAFDGGRINAENANGESRIMESSMTSLEKSISDHRDYHENNRTNPRGYVGRSILQQLQGVQSLCEDINAQTMLDFGCGRGEQYQWRDFTVKGEKINSLVEYFGVDDVKLYDPAVQEHSEKPSEKLDVVISIDVLEHVPAAHSFEVLQDIFSFAKRGVYLSIACYKAGTILPNGENAHVNIKGYRWWKKQVSAAAMAYPDLKIVTCLKYKLKYNKKIKKRWSRKFLIGG